MATVDGGEIQQHKVCRAIAFEVLRVHAIQHRRVSGVRLEYGAGLPSPAICLDNVGFPWLHVHRAVSNDLMKSVGQAQTRAEVLFSSIDVVPSRPPMPECS